MMPDGLYREGVSTILRQVEAGTLGSSSLWRSCLERIAECEAEIGAFVSIGAGDQGPAANRARLGGIPVGIKDIFDTADFPTAYGSPIYRGFRPPRDAYVVTALRRAGAVIAGKTETTEFAGPAPARTRNPRKPTASPGGSSAGSAAAVAAGMLPLALGTQTAGSVIRPAAFCGVIGFKPTFGQIDTSGMRPAAVSLDTIGMFGRHVEDIALLAGVLTGNDELSALPTMERRGRIGLWRSSEFDAASPAVQQASREAVGILEAAGFEIVDVHPPARFEHIAQAARGILAVETARSTAFEMDQAPQLISPQLRESNSSAGDISHAELRAMYETVRACQKAYESLTADLAIDVLITPAAADEAPEGLDWTGDPMFNRVWTALGVPALTLPQCYGPRSLPIGLQLVGSHGSDGVLLSVATSIESVFRRAYGDIFAPR